MADMGKKKKKTGKDSKKKEEQEKKALEEEQAKLRANADAKLQKIREAEERIIRAKQENEERKTRKLEMTELTEILNRNETQLKELNQSRRVQTKWARYMRCDGSPDPVNQGEINTYINLRLQDNTNNDAESVLRDSHLDLMLIEELKFTLMDMPLEEISNNEGNLYKETIEKLENLISTKLDLATLNVLCDTTALANSDTGNLQHVVVNDDIALCVWGNIAKNPRIKSIEFPEIHFTFDIPRVLALGDCAVRALITKYDHYSSTSKAIIPRIKQKEEEPVPVEIEGEDKKDDDKNTEEEIENPDKEKVQEEENEEPEIDIMDALKQAKLNEDLEEQKQEEEPVEIIEEDFLDPSTPELPEWEDFDEEDDVIDLRAYDVLGGAFMLNLLQMPPQPKTVESWIITQCVDPPQICFQDYVADVVSTESGKDKKDERLPININMVLPEDVMFLEQPQVARWDYERKFWTIQGFSDLAFNEEARTFGFKTTKFGTFCLLQDSYINMPFQSWDIRPHKLNSAVFSITAAIVDIQIEIKDSLCCLCQPRDRPELKSVRDKWVTPAELIIIMKKAGINIFPSEDSSKFVSIQHKHPLVEERMYQQMALTASSMAYAWSKWNSERGSGEIIFQGAEAMEDGHLMEEEWSVYMATKRRVVKLKLSEYEESFNEESQNEAMFRSNLYHLVATITSENAQTRINETNFQFIDCVYQLLKATRVLTYS
uniref:IC97/Casc1 N-terminal domain-containing protein n=1 Tax=Arion vulgaris TaxID=1028688 RepID=A0A0B7AJV5_9EUPU